ncbi:MAG: hypothetical protein K2P51_07850 [Rhabdochlamydiaceae bacterium]|nr:hypothetical protein [Rhabdochlamydiaceae bacterium]
MKKRFQTYTALTTLAFSLLLATANADSSPNLATEQTDYSSNSMSGSAQSPASQMQTLVPSLPCPEAWRFSGTFLYLLPTFDDTYFVIESPTSTTYPNGVRKNNDFGFEPAFRLGVEYAFCENNREVQAFYTRFEADQSRRSSGDFLWATLGGPDFASRFENYHGSATSKLNLLYQRLDLNFSQQIVNNKGVYFYLQPGLELAYLRLTEHYRYHLEGATAHGSIRQRSRVAGIGPQMGIGVDYNIYQGTYSSTISHALTLNALFSGSILMGHAGVKESNEYDEDPLLTVKDEKTWRTVPALHAKAGLNYVILGTHVGFSLGLTYEFNTYVRGLARVIFPDDVADAENFTNYYNYDLQGLGITAALSF